MKRIQRQRTKGWRMPPNTVYVGRPSRWGNPFLVGQRDAMGHPRTSLSVVSAYRERMSQLPEEWTWSDWEAFVAPLRGKDLACWCPLDQPCHADVLLELANPGWKP